MKQKNIITLLLLAIVVAVWGLIVSEKKDTSRYVEGFVPNAFADVPPPPAPPESASASGCVIECASGESGCAGSGAGGSCEGGGAGGDESIY